jgi:hypothetical protein
MSTKGYIAILTFDVFEFKFSLGEGCNVNIKDENHMLSS